MAGTTGLEPAASAVTVLLAMMVEMRRIDHKLHERNKLAPVSSSATWINRHPFCVHLHGLGRQGYVTNHDTRPRLGRSQKPPRCFPQNGYPVSGNSKFHYFARGRAPSVTAASNKFDVTEQST
jgi:hypothetical protein